MTPENDFLRIHLDFYDGLNVIGAVTAPPIRPTSTPSPSAIGGTIKGAEQLEDFLVGVGVDSYLVTSGDIVWSTFTATIYDAAPNVIVKALKERFEQAAALQMKILSGEYGGGPQKLAEIPVSVTVCAQHVTSSAGRTRVEAWFSSQG